MTTNKTIHTFLNDAEEQLKNVLKDQEDYDEMEDDIVLSSIREDIEKILTDQTETKLTKTPVSCLGEKKVLKKICKNLDKLDWWLFGEGMTEHIYDLRKASKEKLEEEYVERLCESHRQELEEEGVTDMMSLLSDFGLTCYYKKFGKGLIGDILGRTIRPMTLNDIEELGEKLGYMGLLEYHRNELKEIGIIDMETLRDFGIDNYQDRFGKFRIRRILGGAVANIGRIEAEELGEELWLQS